MAAAGTPAWWSVNSTRLQPPPQHTYPFLCSPNDDESNDDPGNCYYHNQGSLSGLLMGGLVDSNNNDNNHQDYGYTGLDYTNKYLVDFSTRNSKADSQGSSSSSLERDSKCALNKRVRVLQPSSPLKVRKEKLGDRITTLHQLVSPFGKTDTASVLLEVIGYIQFLNTQIEALCLPYLGAVASGNCAISHSLSAQSECDDIFPEDPGQLVNDSCKKKKRTPVQNNGDEKVWKKDLSSRGLCLVPLSCTVQVESDNGADYWAPATLGGGWPADRL